MKWLIKLYLIFHCFHSLYSKYLSSQIYLAQLLLLSLIKEVKFSESATNILNCCFFTINLYFVTSNQIPTYRKLNLSPTGSIYVVVFHAFYYFAWKETTHKPLKVAAAETIFSSVYVIDTTCWKTLLLINIYRYSETLWKTYKTAHLDEMV